MMDVPPYAGRDAPAILSFDGVTTTPDSGSGAGLDAVSLQLHAGESIRLFLRDDPGGVRGWADLACGLATPAAGEILFFGRQWNTLSPREAAAQRARIGRVFSGTAWISNLDIEENLFLAARHHGLASDSELHDRAHQLAQRFGLPGVPQGRPAWASARDLQLAQWIRALLTRPPIFLLEEPVTEPVYAEAGAFIRAMEEACAEGAAVLWLTARKDIASETLIPGMISYSLRSGRLHPGASEAETPTRKEAQP